MARFPAWQWFRCPGLARYLFPLNHFYLLTETALPRPHSQQLNRCHHGGNSAHAGLRFFLDAWANAANGYELFFNVISCKITMFSHRFGKFSSMKSEWMTRFLNLLIHTIGRRAVSPPCCNWSSAIISAIVSRWGRGVEFVLIGDVLKANYMINWDSNYGS